MRTNKYITLVVLAVAGFLSSCNDLLDTTSPSNSTAEYVFSNADDAKKTVLGVYALFAEDPYTSRMSSVWMQNTDVEVSAPSNASSTGDRRDIWTLRGGMLESFSDIKKAWDNNYLAIDRANQCIKGIKASAVANTPDMKMLLGESYCLRAYRYFLLCNFWGDVPYFRDPAVPGMQLDVPKTDKNIIYSGLIQDLVNNEANMYFADEFSDGIERMNREFALGMITRLALFRAGYGMTADGTMKRADDYLNVATNDSLAVIYTTTDGETKIARTYKEYYQLAKDYAQKLISLKDRELPDYATVFMNENRWIKPKNSDVLYEVAFGNTNGGGDVGWCIGVVVKASSYGTTTVQVGYSPTYYYSFDANDTRRDVCVSRIFYNKSETDQDVNGLTAMNVGKWNRIYLPAAPGPSSSKGTGINWPLMRYSDVLLMLAEADNELNEGPTTLAKQLLKRVRYRAFAGADYARKVDAYADSVSSGGKQAFFDALVNERAWEFGGECLRKFDLIRWNIYGKKIVETQTLIDNIGKAANESELTNPDIAKYVGLAKKIYYLNNNGHINFLNFQNTANTDSINGWTNRYGDKLLSKSWWSSMVVKTTTTDSTGVSTTSYTRADFTKNCWIGYKDPTGLTAVPYLLPIATQTISASVFLNNKGYGFVTSSN